MGPFTQAFRTATTPPQPKLKPAPTIPPSTNKGTTVQEAAVARQLGQTIKATHVNTAESLSLLHDLTAPKEGEGQSQIAALIEAVTAIAESQRKLEERQERMETLLERISRTLQPKPV